MNVHRYMLRLLPALLAALLFAALPAAAEPCVQTDAAVALHDGAAQSLAPPAKQTDHASRRQHRIASVEEFLAVDDDAEQYFKTPPVVGKATADFTLATHVAARTSRAEPRVERLPAPFPTGPPHA